MKVLCGYAAERPLQGWIGLMQAVTNDRLDCAVLLLHAGPRIMVPVNHFEDCTVAPTSMLHDIIYLQAYPEDGSDDAGGRLMLAILLQDLVENPKSKYSWAEQVGILLFRTHKTKIGLLDAFIPYWQRPVGIDASYTTHKHQHTHTHIHTHTLTHTHTHTHTHTQYSQYQLKFLT